MVLYSALSLLSSIPPAPLNQYLRHVFGTSILCQFCLELFCLASDLVNEFAQPLKTQTLRYTFAECFSAWAKLVPKQEWRKRKKPIFRLFLSAAVSHRFLLKKLLQLSIRASQQQRLEAERGKGEGFHSGTGPDPLNNKAKWVKAKDMLTEVSWTVPSSVPEALLVYTAFNSVILGPSPALMIGGWLSPPVP